MCIRSIRTTLRWFLQQHALEGDPMPLVRAEEPGGDFQEIEVDGEKFTQSSPPRKLREALKICGLPKGRLKADAWERLKIHQRITRTSQSL